MKDVGKRQFCASGFRQCEWLKGIRIQKEVAW